MKRFFSNALLYNRHNMRLKTKLSCPKSMKYRKCVEKRKKEGCDGDVSISLKFKPCPRHHSILLVLSGLFCVFLGV